MKKSVLFLCTHNSARSQMAEGLLRELAGERYEVMSAGTEKTRVHPLAIEAMDERGVDIRSHHSKLVDEFLDRTIDVAITVCDNARDACPSLPGAGSVLHWSFADPSAATGTDVERLEAFRAVRDEIESRIRTWLSDPV